MNCFELIKRTLRIQLASLGPGWKGAIKYRRKYYGYLKHGKLCEPGTTRNLWVPNNLSRSVVKVLLLFWTSCRFFRYSLVSKAFRMFWCLGIFPGTHNVIWLKRVFSISSLDLYEFNLAELTPIFPPALTGCEHLQILPQTAVTALQANPSFHRLDSSVQYGKK